MCRPASFLITQSRVMWSKDHDSHEELIREAGLSDGLHGGGDFVRTEIVPPGDDYSLPLEQWVYHADQDTVPDWYDAREAEIACRAELPAWAQHHFIRDGQVEVRDRQSRVLLGQAHAKVTGGEVWCYDQARAEVHGGEVMCWDESRAVVHGGEVWCWDESRAVVHGGEVMCWHESRAEVHGGEVVCWHESRAEVHGGLVRCHDQATMDDRRNK